MVKPAKPRKEISVGVAVLSKDDTTRYSGQPAFLHSEFDGGAGDEKYYPPPPLDSMEEQSDPKVALFMVNCKQSLSLLSFCSC